MSGNFPRFAPPSSQQQNGRLHSFEEEERQRIRQLKERLLQSTTPVRTRGLFEGKAAHGATTDSDDSFHGGSGPRSPEKQQRRGGNNGSTSGGTAHRARNAANRAAAGYEEQDEEAFVANGQEEGGSLTADDLAAAPMELNQEQQSSTLPLTATVSHQLHTGSDPAVCVRCLKSIDTALHFRTCNHSICTECAPELLQYHYSLGILTGTIGDEMVSTYNVSCCDCGEISPQATDNSTTAFVEMDADGNFQAVKLDVQTCCNCDSNTAELLCNNCKAPFCRTCCEQFHSKNDHFRKHQWGPITGVRVCPTHKKKLRMFCSQCQLVACSQCFLAEDGIHRGHAPAVSLEEAIRAYTDRFQSSVTSLKQSSHTLSSSIDTIETTLLELDTHYIDRESTIKLQFEQLVAALHAREQQLLAELTSAKDHKVNRLKHQQSALHALKQELDCLVRVADTTMDELAAEPRHISTLNMLERADHRNQILSVLEPRFQPSSSSTLDVSFQSIPSFDNFGFISS